MISSMVRLEKWRISYLGAHGRLKAVMPMMKDVPKTEKPEVGKRLNAVKTAIEKKRPDEGWPKKGESDDSSD